ncbi:DUF4184 family protein [Candidatus Woesearchaeota archaeon]|nr:DUF4184 family protein [Candidatus Woesearchaeota archaeon]
MPFTPFHLGPALLLGLVFFRWINLPALLIGSIIADVEGFSNVFLGVDYPIHGYLHTYLGALGAGIILALLVYSLRRKISPLMTYLHLQQDFTFLSVFVGSVVGTFSHVFLDSFLYTDIKPFFPSMYNPFLGVFSSGAVYGFCMATLLLGLLYYVGVFLLGKKEMSQKK